MPKQAVAHSITPRLPRELPPPIRELIEAATQAHLAAYERLVAFLDDLDADADLEDGGDTEYSLGEGDDREEDSADAEPSLGSGNPSFPACGIFSLAPRIQARLGIDQSFWNEHVGGDSDLEEDHDGREPDQDDEAHGQPVTPAERAHFNG